MIAVSQWLRGELERGVPEAAGKTEVINCGVDLERFRPLDRVGGPSPAFVCVGSLIERKNVVRLANAFARLGEGTLTFVGDGDLRPELDGRAGVTVTGYVPHDAVPGYLAAADVLCQPSLVEPFGQATLEALASARSVVATPIGGPPEFVPAGRGRAGRPGGRGGARRGAAHGGCPSGPEPRGARGGRGARRQGVRRLAWRRLSSEPFEIGEPDLDERPHRVLDPCLAGELERLLVALPRFLGRDALLEPVVSGDEQPLNLGPDLVAVPIAGGVHIRSLNRQDHAGVTMKTRKPPPVRLLIADDHRLFAEALEAVLSTEERIEVVGRAADGGEAVAMAEELGPDVIALDISMPVMDGFEAAAELEKLAHPPAILMLTGSSAPEDIDRARRVGAKGYITKDAIAARLVDAILAAAEVR